MDRGRAPNGIGHLIILEVLEYAPGNMQSSNRGGIKYWDSNHLGTLDKSKSMKFWYHYSIIFNKFLVDKIVWLDGWMHGWMIIFVEYQSHPK